MKLVWHIMKKDLRAVWPVALGWLSLIALRIPLLLYVLNTKSVDERTMHCLSLISVCAIFGDVLLVFSVVRGLVHEDALAGDKAFWITRPVTGCQLLAAKAINLFLICVVCPLALLVPTWFGFGFNGEEIRHADDGSARSALDEVDLHSAPGRFLSLQFEPGRLALPALGYRHGSAPFSSLGLVRGFDLRLLMRRFVSRLRVLGGTDNPENR